KDRKTLWQDISKGKPGILKLWKDGKWNPVVPDVESVKKETLEQVNKNIESTKEELNKKVEEAQKETSGQFKEVTENLQEVSLTIKNVQNSQGEMNKTVSEMKQTNESFTKSIELLTKNDGEITNKLNTVEDTVEGTKQIISDVKQTTNNLKKTTTEMEERAGKINEKLTSLETKANTLTNKTTEIEKSVNGIKETVTKVENNQGGFDKRVTAVEKTAEGISQNVTKIQETQTAQGKQIFEAQSTIKQHSDALNLAVKMKDVEDYVGGIGNQTVLRNVLWKNDTKYWQLTSNAVRDTQVTYKGCNSLSVITTGNASNLYRGASHDYINAGPGWNYVFSAYFYTDNKASIDAGAAIELQCYDVNNKMIKNYLQEITISQGTWIRTHVAGLLVEGTKKVKVLFWARKNGRLW
ncbi:coiled-coil domain-containing protein, partial [Bacillus toyonensis]|uniref:coiled-coil domain-containing protein n=1 Tax=Bacillus toyonensis TaxID=155322 RepID=UPI002ECFA6D5|nr:hypothetical protein [Bacillus toyonensis]